MQLYAWDETRSFIHALNATKHKDYTCFECLGPVRARRGVQRQPHYYHLATSSTCRQNGKSIEHLQIQLSLKKLLAEHDVQLEYRFDSIGRIADVFWVSEKVVFEIQCSNIDGHEVLARNEDYAKEGIQVVWIFHEETFNRKRLKGAEIALKNGHYYFTNMDALGNGIIYDQWEELRIGTLRTAKDKYPVNLSHIKKEKVDHIRKHRPFYFAGDCVDRSLTGEIIFYPPQKRTISLWERAILRPYQLLLQILLEKSC